MVDLLNGMLDRNPKNRFDIDMVVNHRAIQKNLKKFQEPLTNEEYTTLVKNFLLNSPTGLSSDTPEEVLKFACFDVPEGDWVNLQESFQNTGYILNKRKPEFKSFEGIGAGQTYLNRSENSTKQYEKLQEFGRGNHNPQGQPAWNDFTPPSFTPDEGIFDRLEKTNSFQKKPETQNKKVIKIDNGGDVWGQAAKADKAAQEQQPKQQTGNHGYQSFAQSQPQARPQAQAQPQVQPQAQPQTQPQTHHRPQQPEQQQKDQPQPEPREEDSYAARIAFQQTSNQPPMTQVQRDEGYNFSQQNGFEPVIKRHHYGTFIPQSNGEFTMKRVEQMSSPQQSGLTSPQRLLSPPLLQSNQSQPLPTYKSPQAPQSQPTQTQPINRAIFRSPEAPPTFTPSVSQTSHTAVENNWDSTQAFKKVQRYEAAPIKVETPEPKRYDVSRPYEGMLSYIKSNSSATQNEEPKNEEKTPTSQSQSSGIKFVKRVYASGSFVQAPSVSPWQTGSNPQSPKGQKYDEARTDVGVQNLKDVTADSLKSGTTSQNQGSERADQDSLFTTGLVSPKSKGQTRLRVDLDSKTDLTRTYDNSAQYKSQTNGNGPKFVRAATLEEQLTIKNGGHGQRISQYGGSFFEADVKIKETEMPWDTCQMGRHKPFVQGVPEQLKQLIEQPLFLTKADSEGPTNNGQPSQIPSMELVRHTSAKLVKQGLVSPPSKEIKEERSKTSGKSFKINLSIHGQQREAPQAEELKISTLQNLWTPADADADANKGSMSVRQTKSSNTIRTISQEGSVSTRDRVSQVGHKYFKI